MSGFGVFASRDDQPRVGWRVDDSVLDLAGAGLGDVFASPELNPFLALGRNAWEDAIGRIETHLAAGRGPLVPLDDVEEAEEVLEVPYSGDALDIGFNVNYLLDVLNNVDGAQLECSFGDAASSASSA